jgi:hypothetical protein
LAFSQKTWTSSGRHSIYQAKGPTHRAPLTTRVRSGRYDVRTRPRYAWRDVCESEAPTNAALEANLAALAPAGLVGATIDNLRDPDIRAAAEAEESWAKTRLATLAARERGIPGGGVVTTVYDWISFRGISPRGERRRGTLEDFVAFLIERRNARSKHSVPGFSATAYR